jgi:glycosyltransferase involved in cell wall biosynthesis
MSATPWLFVSKPLEAPLRDGSQVLVSHLVSHLDPRFHVSYFGEPGFRSEDSGAWLAAPQMGYAPAVAAKMRMLATLMKPRYRRTRMHFFFTPNTVTSSAVALLKRLEPRRPIVQSLMSSAGAAGHARLLAPLDAVVVLSLHARDRLVGAGLDAGRVRCIYPAVRGVDAPARGPDARRVLYAGDLDGAVVERLVRVMRALERAPGRPWILTVACRPKAPRDAEHRSRLAALLAPQLAAGRAELLGEVENFAALWRDTALQVFVADHVERKVDLPLVLLEGLAAGVPLVALDFAPLNEIFAVARGRALDVGAAVPPGDGDALEEAVLRTLRDVLRREAQGRDARRLAQLEFSLPAMAQRYADLYDELERERASDWQPSRSSAG